MRAAQRACPEPAEGAGPWEGVRSAAGPHAEQLRGGGERTWCRMQASLAVAYRRRLPRLQVSAEGHNGAVRVPDPARKAQTAAVTAVAANVGTAAGAASAACLDSAAPDDNLVALLPAHDR